jgi:hypothetical protein
MNFINKFYSKFFNEASKSDINYQLAAGILKNKKLVTKPCCNQNRNYCRGKLCSSIHAEANAILHYYGKNLKFDPIKNRWYLLSYKFKKIKED